MFEQITIRNNRTRNRNHSFECSAMQCSKVDLTIRNDAHKPELRKRIKCGFDIWGNPVFCNGQILMRPNVPGAPLAFDTYGFPFDLQPGCDPQLTQQILGGVGGSIINGLPAFQNKFLFLHLAHTEDLWSERLCFFDSNTFSQNDIDWGNYLGSEWDIHGGWSATTAPDNGPWARVPLGNRIPTDTAALPLPVYGINRIFSYMLEIFLLRDGSYAVLPVAYYQNQFYHVPLRLYIPPNPPYTLLNTHLLAVYPNATVVLTDDIIIALANQPSPEMVYLANPGGDDWIDHLDLVPVVGRKVICTVFNANNQEEKKQYYRTAVKMAEKLHAAGITPRFAIMKSEGGVS